jgi:hypothetical protein
MIWISENFNRLSNSELEFLKNKCKNFILTESPILYNNGLTKNYYHRYKFNVDDLEFKEIINKITEHIKKETNHNEIELWTIQINKIFEGSNEEDELHVDSCDLTFILYLNNEFEGGEFEYINQDKKIIKIKPKENFSIISNDKLIHRVLPVSSGERFSLVMFFNIGKKNKLTLI